MKPRTKLALLAAMVAQTVGLLLLAFAAPGEWTGVKSLDLTASCDIAPSNSADVEMRVAAVAARPAPPRIDVPLAEAVDPSFLPVSIPDLPFSEIREPWQVAARPQYGWDDDVALNEESRHFFEPRVREVFAVLLADKTELRAGESITFTAVIRNGLREDRLLIWNIGHRAQLFQHGLQVEATDGRPSYREPRARGVCSVGLDWRYAIVPAGGQSVVKITAKLHAPELGWNNQAPAELQPRPLFSPHYTMGRDPNVWKSVPASPTHRFALDFKCDRSDIDQRARQRLGIAEDIQVWRGRLISNPVTVRILQD